MITNNPKNIFVVDDSSLFRVSLSDILTEAGHNVKTADDGLEVINTIAGGPFRIDLMVLDLVMPVVDGFHILEWMGDNGHMGKFPVLVMTGVYEPVNLIENLRALGVAGFMKKGLSPEEIVFRVNNLLFPEKMAQRTAERVPVHMPVHFAAGEAVMEENAIEGVLLNISETGAFLNSDKKIPVGSEVSIGLKVPSGNGFAEGEVKGVVRWTTADAVIKTLFGGCGIMFTSVPLEIQEALKSFVELQKINIEQECNARS